MNLKKLGNILRVERRDTSRVSLRELSRKTGVSYATLSEVERGLVEPKITTLVKICDALIIPLDELVRRSR